MGKRTSTRTHIRTFAHLHTLNFVTRTYDLEMSIICTIFVLSLSNMETIIKYRGEKVYLSTLTQEQTNALAKKMLKTFAFEDHINYCVLANKLSKKTTRVTAHAHHDSTLKDSHAWRHLNMHVEYHYLNLIGKTKSYFRWDINDTSRMEVRKGYVSELCFAIIEKNCGFKPIKTENFADILRRNQI